MKFLCIPCDQVMAFEERQLPGDGTLAAVFKCPGCGREMAMLTNPMETQLVSGLGIKIGGRTVPDQPMELMRSSLEGGRPDAFEESAAEAPAAVRIRVTWTPEALERLERVPSFVRGMVKRIYADWAQENGISVFTPETMDRARTELGLEGTVNDERLRSKFKQAAFFYLHMGILYEAAVFEMARRGLLEARGGAPLVWLVAGAGIVALVFWGLWAKQNVWVARIIWGLGLFRLPALVGGAFFPEPDARLPGSFFLVALVIVLVNLWLLARAGWDL